MGWSSRRGALTMLAAGLLLAGCSGGSGPTSAGPPPDRPASHSASAGSQPTGSVTASPRSSSGLPRPAHVVVVVFENKAAHQVLGSGHAPYLNSLAASGARFTNSHGVTHPSQPNYLALFSGSTQGVTDDSCPQELGDRPNLAEQLDRAGFTFTGYSEALPTAGYTGCTAGEYARRHNPWVNFTNVPATSNLPFSDFPADLSQLPTVSFVIPDLCHDMHDCDVATGDQWARQHLAPYVSWARTHDSLLVVTFDEDEGTSTNQIPTFLVGPMVRRTTIPQRITHDNVLRTLEDLYGLAPLGKARDAAPLAGWVR